MDTDTTQDPTILSILTQSVPYSEIQAWRWLTFLALNLQRHEETVFLIEQLQPTWLMTHWQRWFYILISHLLWVVLFVGVGGGVISGLVTNGLINGLWVMLSFLLIFVFMWIKRSNLRSANGKICTTETIIWSWTNARQNGYRGLIIFIVVGLLVGLIVGVVDGLLNEPPLRLIDRLLNGLVFGVIGGPIFGLLGGLIGSLIGGFTAGVREMDTQPNQGIRLTVRYALRMGCIAGFLAGLIVGLVGLFFENVSIGLVFGLISGLLASLWYGGFDVLQHGIIRLLLWWRGDAPLNYARFLDYATTELHFLQKVGGGYIFVHRYLLEHFAAMAEENK